MKIEIIPDKTFEKLLKDLDAPVARRASIKGVNVAGKSLKRDAPKIITSTVVSTTKTNLGMKARAASEHRTGEPNYTIRLKGAVPVSKLRASARKFKKKKRGSDSGRLSLDFPGVGDDIAFKSVKKAGRGSYTLNRAGDLPERFLGPVGFRTRFRNSRELKQRLTQAGDQAAAAIMKELVKTLGGR